MGLAHFYGNINMSKRIWYSKPLSEMWSQYNKFYKLYRGTVDEFYFEKNKQIFSTPNQKPEDIQSHASILDLWRLDIHKKFIHIYFKQKELRDFLQIVQFNLIKEVSLS